ncbi:MAG TPA: TolC family protein, partial [Planctomycetaceae bacterium]|nr:TolC family protein [Planctomycetaceae bacterium]
NLDLTTQGYESQQFDFLRVLTARRTYFETNINYVNSLINLRQSEVRVNGMVLSGGLNSVQDISQGVGGTSNRGQALSGQ